MGGSEYLHVDLCTGLGGWAAPFQESPDWRSIGLDIRADFRPDIVGDIRHLPINCRPTLLTMSPPCTAFSRYCMPWLDEPNPDMSLVRAALEAAEEMDPEYWILENVRGLKQYWGREERKKVGPFFLWGDFPPFDAPTPTAGKMDTAGQNPEERAQIPYELADAVRSTVEVYADAS